MSGICIWCDFGDCQRCATVWVKCDGVERPYCDLHKEDHSVHVGQGKYESEIEGWYIKCDAAKTSEPISRSNG